ncbi:MAG: hypothetical protein AABZ27_07820 [Candidatus Omnitrophota bacterium]
MKILNSESLYRVIPRLNLVLCLSVLGLVFYLLSIWKHLYQPRTRKFETAVIEPSIKLREVPIFKEELFKNRRLFSTFFTGKVQERKSAFILLGVSMGTKNLAMIRDQVENKNYYCALGDSIGSFKVKQILRDKVILESADTTLELVK